MSETAGGYLPTPERPRAKYVCREHGEPVDFKGRGCPECQAEQLKRDANRDRRKRSKREPRWLRWERLMSGDDAWPPMGGGIDG